MRAFLFLAVCSAVSLSLFASSSKPLHIVWKKGVELPQSTEDIKSRFVMAEDTSAASIAGIRLPSTWWSRPQEYAWAATFAGSEFVVLDAGCGIHHPFKWYLGQSCRSTWACDTDWRIEDKDQIFENTKELGDEAYDTVRNTIYPWKNVNLFRASMTSLPKAMPLFDRIFCISTLEHMSPLDRKKVLIEFSRKLAPHGRVVITIDYPTCTPDELFALADDAGLVPAGDVSKGEPPKGALYNQGLGLYIYRCVLKHKNA